MHVISRKAFNDASKKYPNDALSLDSLYRVLNSGKFASSLELKKVIPSLDNFKYKPDWWVIDVGGNNLRLLAFITFRNGTVMVKHIVPHAEYDKLTNRYRKNEI